MATSMFSLLATCLAFLSLPQPSVSLGKTDTITWGGDTSRANYETNHNLDPRTIASAEFGNIWTAKLPGNFNGIGAEQVLSQPLVYTTGDGIQYVFVATTQNNLYKINAKTGDIVKTRNIGVPFLTADLGNCNDIAPAIGVSGTGVIDPSTGYWYLTSKTYTDDYQSGNFGPSNPPGRANGRYYFHAINTADLSEAPNFPTPVHHTVFRNNQNRWLVAGDQHQRPALLQVGDFIYTGWASHCIQYNYTGAIIGFHKTSGAIVEAYATQGGLEPNTVSGGGVWMSGGGLAYDGAGGLFFSTGNGYASQLPADGHPVPGRNPPTALEEAVVHMNLNGDGTISPVDFFMPWEKTQLDGADKDLGTTPFQLLPSSFTCPNSKRVGVITGKSGKTYFLNVDNLGGYQQGANRLDAAIAVYQHENSVYSASGVMPLGNYIYVNVINHKTRVFQFSCKANGDGAITEITTAAEKNAQALGVGHGTTTSLDGRAGSGLYWTTDVDGQDLRIYDATPPSDGSALKLIRGFNIPGPGKFAKPVFGDSRAYVGARGALYAFGSPVNLPLNCTSPVAFPKTSVNSTSDALTINCTALVATTVTAFNISGNPNFVLDSPPAVPFTLAVGKTFSFRARFAPAQIGSLSSDAVITTNNQVAGSATKTPVTLTGTSNSAAAQFVIQPITVTFNSTFGAGPVQKSVFFSNDGDASLTVTNVQFSTSSETGPWIQPNTTGDGQQVAQFTFSGIPSTIDGNSRQAVGITYNPPSAGNHVVFVKVTTNGGSKILDVFGTTGSPPAALFEFQRADGSGWDQYTPGKNFTFGNVAPGQVVNLVMRITNNGSSSASPLGLTVSKPPFGVSGFLRAANSIDLAEGTQIPAGQSANATLFCAPPERQVNTPSTQAGAGWRINTNSDQGAVILTFDCTAASPQVGPLFSNGTAQNSYIGCYQDETPGRQLATQLYYDDNNNTAARCISQCAAGGYNFTGLIFRRECWCGNALPLSRGIEDDCNYRCTGDTNHTCGGDGAAHNQHMISLFADTTKWDGVLQGPPLSMTNSSGNYQYAGCYAESNNVKTFNVKRQTSALNTVDSCRKFCGSSYPLFGLQYSSECYCGSAIAASSKLTDDSQCSMTCKGNNSQFCGGSARMQVYQLPGTIPTTSSSSSSTGTATGTWTGTASATSSAPALPSESDGVSTRIGAYQYQGCYNEVPPNRALTAKAKFDDDNMTNRMCADFCSGSVYWATEFARECYCGDTLDSGSLVTTDGRCSMTCKGNSSETCGGENGLTLFKLVANSSSSSSSSVTSTTTLTSSSATSTGTTTTLSTSTTSTSASASASATPLKCPDSNGTTYVSGQQTFLVECGKDYQGNDLKAVGLCFSDLEPNVDLIRDFLFLILQCIDFDGFNFNCVNFNDAILDHAIFDHAIFDHAIFDHATFDHAIFDHTIFDIIFRCCNFVNAIHDQHEYTSSTLSTSTSSLATSSSSSTSSSVSSTSSSTLSTSSTTLSTSTTTSQTSSKTSTQTGPPTVAATAGIYNSLGCFQDKSSNRALIEVYTNKSMTPELCAAEAKRRTYDFMGLEYGTECWMGDLLNTTKSPSLAQSKCNTACPGDNSTLCGAGGALQMYQVNSTLVVPKQNATSGVALSCPQSDDTVWTSSTGARFRIECGWDRSGGTSSTVTAATYEDCLNACAKTSGCGAVALKGKSCYVKTGALGTEVRSDSIRGATLLTNKEELDVGRNPSRESSTFYKDITPFVSKNKLQDLKPILPASIVRLRQSI
ncbi:hypothetical protein PRZ48_005069 [Zasmidium cellare]|uniref:WSC domain-containing protein n=1 Tax=Zasmidium cellare TaxID=395010 RepID=A0ABR0ESH7_ZASCE|nr:hypothetical protein PRZ48_005069 [Zasmidium cellare]